MSPYHRPNLIYIFINITSCVLSMIQVMEFQSEASTASQKRYTHWPLPSVLSKIVVLCNQKSYL